jgi:hypothetical protein
MPLSPAASSLADRPSTMKLFERLRWLAMDSPCPGMADVSANSCVLLVLVGETPGTSSARSRKFRPFIGRLWTSACGMVPAIWLRAVSSAWVSATTVIAASMPATSRPIERSNAEPALSAMVRACSLNPSRRTRIS